MSALNPRKYAGEFLLAYDQNIKYDGSSFYFFNDSYYRAISNDELKSKIADFYDTSTPHLLSRPIKKKDIEEISSAIIYLIIDTKLTNNRWIKKCVNFSDHNSINLKNGILNFESKQLRSHTNQFFTTSCLEVNFDPTAKELPVFYKFLNEIWSNDSESIDCLQEFLGLILTCITYFQKALLLVGPPRSGKGTILKLIECLVGKINISTPTLNMLSTNFGLTSLIDKKVAIITDARVSHRSDTSAAIEALLRITGEDSLTIARKYLNDWQGNVGARFIIATNEMPALFDSSNALANRFVVLQMTKSFLGKEDNFLFDKISKELPAILNWSLEGLDRVIKRGHFVQPKSGMDSINLLKELGSPIETFIDDCCVIDVDGTVACYELFNMWKEWCLSNNFQHAGTSQTFGKNLKSCKPQIQVGRYSETKKKYYKGIRQSPEYILNKN